MPSSVTDERLAEWATCFVEWVGTMFSGLGGDHGEVRVGGRVAARLAGWSVSFDAGPREYVVRGALADVREAWLRPGLPVEVRLRMPRTIWRWTGATLAREGDLAVLTGLSGEPQIM